MTHSLKETIATLEQTEEFHEFETENPDHYLVHIFTTASLHESGTKIAPAELGYYGRSKDRITVFKTEPVKRMEEEEVFKEHGTLKKLLMENVQISVASAIDLAVKFQKESYPAHQAMRLICILQEQDRPVWNITIVTNTLQMANYKIDAADGTLLSKDMRSLMSLSKE